MEKCHEVVLGTSVKEVVGLGLQPSSLLINTQENSPSAKEPAP